MEKMNSAVTRLLQCSSSRHRAAFVATMVSWRPIILVFLPFSAGYFLSYFFRTAINAVLAWSSDEKELGLTNASNLGLMTSAYFLTFAAVQIPPLGVEELLDQFRAATRAKRDCSSLRQTGAVLFASADRFETLLHRPRADRIKCRCRRIDRRPQSNRLCAFREGAGTAPQRLLCSCVGAPWVQWRQHRRPNGC